MAVSSKTIWQTILIVLLLPVIAFNLWAGYNVHILSAQRAQIKKDYSHVNSITNGLLSVDAWKGNIQDIASNRIRDFTLTPEQTEALRGQISNVLNALISQADSMLRQKQKSVGGKIRKLAVNMFVNWSSLRSKVPLFTQTIIDQINRPENRDKMKALVQQKLNEFAAQTHDSTSDTTAMQNVLARYNAFTIDDFNKKTEQETKELQNKTYQFSFIMIGTMVLFLILWWFVSGKGIVEKPLFVLSVLLALTVLAVGLTSPMIEIDARIHELDFTIMKQQLQFHDQVIFYQSKSILDVVRILLATEKIDSIFVGILILIFSIIFPITKLLCTQIYLLGNDKIRRNKFVRYFAFKSGKWSMADVTVVAIFMAYIGFKGIFDSQMRDLDMQTNSLRSIATNLTSLQPGFILFVSFVVFSLVLSEILKRILRRKPKYALTEKEAASLP